MGVLCCHFRPKMFSPGDHVRYHSRTLGAHVLATVVGPSPNGTQFCHIRYIRPGGVTPVDHESAQLSRLAPQLRGKPAGLAVQAGAKAAAKPAPRAIASSSTRKSLHTCSLCLRQWRVPQFALRYPCNAPPPPPGHRHLVTVSPPHPGDRRALPRDFARGGEGTSSARAGMIESRACLWKWLMNFLAARDPPSVLTRNRYREQGIARRPVIRRSRCSAVLRQLVINEGCDQDDNQALTRGWEGVQWARTPCTLRLWRLWQWGHGHGGGFVPPETGIVGVAPPGLKSK